MARRRRRSYRGRCCGCVRVWLPFSVHLHCVRHARLLGRVGRRVEWNDGRAGVGTRPACTAGALLQSRTRMLRDNAQQIRAVVYEVQLIRSPSWDIDGSHISAPARVGLGEGGVVRHLRAQPQPQFKKAASLSVLWTTSTRTPCPVL